MSAAQTPRSNCPARFVVCREQLPNRVTVAKNIRNLPRKLLGYVYLLRCGCNSLSFVRFATRCSSPPTIMCLRGSARDTERSRLNHAMKRADHRKGDGMGFTTPWMVFRWDGKKKFQPDDGMGWERVDQGGLLGWGVNGSKGRWLPKDISNG